jgi:hypothetical protein
MLALPGRRGRLWHTHFGSLEIDAEGNRMNRWVLLLCIVGLALPALGDESGQGQGPKASEATVERIIKHIPADVDGAYVASSLPGSFETGEEGEAEGADWPEVLREHFGLGEFDHGGAAAVVLLADGAETGTVSVAVLIPGKGVEKVLPDRPWKQKAGVFSAQRDGRQTLYAQQIGPWVVAASSEEMLDKVRRPEATVKLGPDAEDAGGAAFLYWSGDRFISSMQLAVMRLLAPNPSRSSGKVPSGAGRPYAVGDLYLALKGRLKPHRTVPEQGTAHVTNKKLLVRGAMSPARTAQWRRLLGGGVIKEEPLGRVPARGAALLMHRQLLPLDQQGQREALDALGDWMREAGALTKTEIGVLRPLVARLAGQIETVQLAAGLEVPDGEDGADSDGTPRLNAALVVTCRDPKAVVADLDSLAEWARKKWDLPEADQPHTLALADAEIRAFSVETLGDLLTFLVRIQEGISVRWAEAGDEAVVLTTGTEAYVALARSTAEGMGNDSAGRLPSVVSTIGQVASVQTPLVVELRNTPALVSALGGGGEDEASERPDEPDDQPNNQPAWTGIHVEGLAAGGMPSITIQSMAERKAKNELVMYWFMNHAMADGPVHEPDEPASTPEDAEDF